MQFRAHENRSQDGETGADDTEGGLDLGPVGEGGLVVGDVVEMEGDDGGEVDEDDEADQGGEADAVKTE